MRTRRSVTLATLAVASLLLPGCGSSATTDSAASATSTTPATPAGTPSALSTKDPARDGAADLVIWCENERAAVISQQAQAFAEQNNIKVAVQVAADVRRAFEDATKVGKGPDIMVGPHDLVGTMVQNGLVAPVNLSPETVSGFTKAAIAGATLNGQIYGTPYAVENIALVRNTALAPEAPASVDDMVATGKKLVAEGKATTPLIQEVGKTGNAYFAYPWLAAYDGGLFAQKPNGEYDAAQLLVGSPGSIKGAELLARLGRENVLSTNISGDNADALFDSGKAPFYLTGPWSLAKAEKAGIPYAVSNLPVAPGGKALQPLLGVQLFYVSAKAKNQTLAEEFAASFVPKKEVQVALFEAGHRPPALTAAYDEIAAKNPQIKAWFEAGKDAKPMPNIPAMNAVWGPLGQAEADVISGQAAPAARFTKAAQEISTALAGK